MGNGKSLAAAKYILQKRSAEGDSVTPMQLIKLVYIAQGFMLGKKGRPLLDESVEAWQYGPVVPSVYHAVKSYRSSPVISIRGNVDVLSDDEKEILDLVSESYAKYDGVTLSSATHKEGTPWRTTWLSLGKNSPIPNDLIENFYSDLIKRPTHSAL